VGNGYDGDLFAYFTILHVRFTATSWGRVWIVDDQGSRFVSQPASNWGEVGALHGICIEAVDGVCLWRYPETIVVDVHDFVFYFDNKIYISILKSHVLLRDTVDTS